MFADMLVVLVDTSHYFQAALTTAGIATGATALSGGVDLNIVG
jgi:hypothetical protein